MEEETKSVDDTANFPAMRRKAAYVKEYMKVYMQKPGVKDRVREQAKIREQSEVMKQKRKEYRASPEQKELARQRILRYRSKEENRVREKERNKTYVVSDERKAKNAEWSRTKRINDVEWAEKQRERNRLRMKAYNKLDHIKERIREYGKRSEVRERAKQLLLSNPDRKNRKKKNWYEWYRSGDNAERLRAKAKEYVTRPDIAQRIKERVLMIGTSSAHRARYYGCVTESVNRLSVYERDRWRCVSCGCKVVIARQYQSNRATIDHRIPLSRGGSHTYENCQTMCMMCNSKKEATMPIGRQLTVFDRVVSS